MFLPVHTALVVISASALVTSEAVIAEILTAAIHFHPISTCGPRRLNIMSLLPPMLLFELLFMLFCRLSKFPPPMLLLLLLLPLLNCCGGPAIYIPLVTHPNMQIPAKLTIISSVGSSHAVVVTLTIISTETALIHVILERWQSKTTSIFKSKVVVIIKVVSHVIIAASIHTSTAHAAIIVKAVAEATHALIVTVI